MQPGGWDGGAWRGVECKWVGRGSLSVELCLLDWNSCEEEVLKCTHNPAISWPLPTRKPGSFFWCADGDNSCLFGYHAFCLQPSAEMLTGWGKPEGDTGQYSWHFHSSWCPGVRSPTPGERQSLSLAFCPAPVSERLLSVLKNGTFSD